MIHKILSAGALAAVLLAANPVSQEPDNTRANKRDESKHAATADKQSNDPADMKLLREIRREFVRGSFSTYAKNVKILTHAGQVTLRGPVKSSEEKASLEAIAKKLAGDNNVISHLEVAK
ncbi:MAG: BON domain-containing protein [Bryobacteraceae bacterium]|nr:BON domain-containing protein [Bryobacteraceae bacterium]